MGMSRREKEREGQIEDKEGEGQIEDKEGEGQREDKEGVGKCKVRKMKQKENKVKGSRQLSLNAIPPLVWATSNYE
jgi:hypothetical protein